MKSAVALRSADRPYAVAIIGAGFAGIGAAAALAQAGVDDFVILERADDVGGVWRDNTYPGARCDVPSALYSYSYLPNPNWSDRFSSQPEIHAYLRGAIDELGLAAKLHTGCQVTEARWDSKDLVWAVTLGDGTEVSTRLLIVGSGAMNEPATPRIAGLDEFSGQVFHSARWPATFDPAGRRIGVIGTGASAVQLVPEIAASAAHMAVFQRTAPWIVARGDRAIPRWLRQIHDRVPGSLSTTRGANFIRRELMTGAFTKSNRLLSLIEVAGRRHLARQVSDEHLRAQVTPTFRAGCKRIILSDDWYPTLARNNVELVTDPIHHVTTDGVVTASGAAHDLDTIVMATGFHVQRRLILSAIIGAQGASMASTMVRTAPSAYLGSTVPGFPNLILMTGPNTGLANNSMILMIESQARYAADMARYLQANAEVALDVKQAVMDDFTAELTARLDRSVWATGGCASWYQDAHGRVTALWPGTTTEFRRRTRQISLPDYTVVSGFSE